MTCRIELEVIPVTQELPSEGRSVIVVCKSLQVLGFLGARRVWHEGQPPHRRLDDVIGWYDDAS